MIKSVYSSNKEIIYNITKIYGNIDCDLTYSRGTFYKDLKRPKYKFDIAPKNNETIKSDSRFIPVKDNQFKVIMFDPPFLATTGKSLISNDDNNIITKRFDVFPNEQELHKYYAQSLKEIFRITKKNGFLIFKCQDKVSSGKQYMSHCFIWEKAVEIGWYPKDLFILVAKNRIVADWQRNQKHARKFHCYFWVFQKKPINIKYE